MPETFGVKEFDLKPHPRILPMLGEINLEQWRCLAELVDNSIDAFLAAERDGMTVYEPEVHISIPTSDDPSAKVTVRDNGPGMDLDTLENAVRAGWTNNDPINNLGMFGMGFNIATARLGKVTRVWTTRAEDPEWYGLEIDFADLIGQKHFSTPMLTRPKNDSMESGTEVSIEGLKPEQREWLSKTANRTKVSKRLGTVYSAMLRDVGVPISFRLCVNGTQVKGRNHCVWGGDGGPERTVESPRYGVISAYQLVDSRFEERPFCTRCWQWLTAREAVCPTCESADAVVQRERRVHGWLGIQRYLSGQDFGIDFVRHGRKIETGSKDLFVWNDEESIEPEYPIDDPRNRGRIVGEIHIDHCRVSYTKDRFDRDDPSWADMIKAVRGDGPLRPDKAAERGYGENVSPLFRLFQAFRRSSPKPKTAGCYAKLLIVPDNDRAESMAKRFYAAEPEYRTDSKWWELIEEADRQLLTPSKPSGTGGLSDLEPDTGGTDLDGTARDTRTTSSTPPKRTPMPSLSRVYREEAANTNWDVSAFQVDPIDPELGDEATPWKLKMIPNRGADFYVNVGHSVFQSATMTPLDALLAEIASSAMDMLRRDRSIAGFAAILSNLRDRYAGVSKLDPASLSSEAAMALTRIARSISTGIDVEDSRSLFNQLSPAEQQAIQSKMATRAVRSPEQTVDKGLFLEYAPRKTLLMFFERNPDLFLDGQYWDTAYASLDYGNAAATEDARAIVVRNYLGLLMDAIWLADQDITDLADASRERLLRAALALDLLAETATTETE